MNRNTIRLIVAALAGWLLGALGGLAVVPYSVYTVLFVAVLAVPVLIAVTEFRPGPAGRQGALTVLRGRYRLAWAVPVLVLAVFMGWINLFLFAQAVVAVDGERVQATLADTVRTERWHDPGEDVECVLARPDGRRIPGALPLDDADTCRQTEDVLVDPYGIVDPVRYDPDSIGATQSQILFLAIILALSVPAAWPRRAAPTSRGPRTPARPRPGRVRRRCRPPAVRGPRPDLSTTDGRTCPVHR